MRQVSISVIIPAYNAETTIERCIQSVQNQSYTDFEVIVIDDGSQDNTADKISQLCMTDNRIRFYSQTNKGVSSARNTALSYATGKYIMFVDGDDYIQNQYLQTYYDVAERENADVVIGGCKRINLTDSETVEIIPQVIGDISVNIWNLLMNDTSVYGFVCSKIIKRDLIENNNIRYNENMYSQEDLSFNLDVYDKANKIISIADTSYIYEYKQSNRKPDLVGYIKNQLKLLDICNRKHILTEQMKDTIRMRIESYCFGYLLYSEDKEQAVEKLQYIDGLDQVFKEIHIRNEKDYVCWMLAHSHNSMVRMHFYCRDIAKNLLGRGNK